MNIFNKESQYYPFAILLAVAIAAWVLRGCTTAPVVEQPAKVVAPSLAPVSAPQVGCCEKAWPGTRDGASHTTRGTSYFPDASTMEGGFQDRRGIPLRTLQGFLGGTASYVSVAMDKTVGYGTKICIPSLNKAYGKPIAFKVVDTGGAFYGKQWSRADICTSSRKDSLSSAINATWELIECR